nr:MAG TPA: hypothetical protein [Caudoviricetes sp.]
MWSTSNLLVVSLPACLQKTHSLLSLSIACLRSLCHALVL